MMDEAQIAAAVCPPDGFALLGWYLPAVHMVFATPTRGVEERFTPVFVRVMPPVLQSEASNQPPRRS